MIQKLFLGTLFFSICAVGYAQQNSISRSGVIQCGPLNGYAEMREAVVWIQTKKAVSVSMMYWSKNDSSIAFHTDTIQTEKTTGYTAKLLADEVMPGTVYEYRILINDVPVTFEYPLEFKTQMDWAYKTNPPAFKMIISSCSYINEPISDRPGEPYGGNYEIFETMASMKPDAVFWLGDNVYLRPMDWGSRTGFIHRYTHSRSIPELQKLLATGQHFAIWDDHDFGPNDANGSFTGETYAHEIFRLFWPNPTLMTFEGEQSIATAFDFCGISFFALDDRSFRTENFKDSSGQVYGKAQLDWLINNLAYSRSPFKIVACGGQILNDAQVYENLSNYTIEYNYLLQRIEEENIKGVIFITGDRHHSEISKLINKKSNALWDITCSPATSKVAVDKEEVNNLRVEKSLVAERNFAVLEFTGKQKERVLTVTYYSVSGEELFRHTISETEIYKRN